MTTNEWYERTTGGDSVNAVANKAGIPKSTLWQQAHGTITTDTVVKIARAYGINPAQALADIGLITADELAGGSNGLNLTHCTDTELVREIGRRLKNRHE